MNRSPDQIRSSNEAWRKRYDINARRGLITVFVQLGQLEQFIADAAEGGNYNDTLKRLVGQQGHGAERVIRIDMVEASDFDLGVKIELPQLNDGAQVGNIFTTNGRITAVNYSVVGQQYDDFSEVESDFLLKAAHVLRTPNDEMASDTRFLGDVDRTLIKIGDNGKMQRLNGRAAPVIIAYHAPTESFIARGTDGIIVTIRAAELIENPGHAKQLDRWQAVRVATGLSLDRVGPFNEYAGQFTAPVQGRYHSRSGNGQISFNPGTNQITLTAELDNKQPYVVTSLNGSLVTYDGTTLARIAGGTIPAHRSYATAKPTRARTENAAPPAA